MANAFVQVADDGTGKKLQTVENTISSEDVHAQASFLVTTAGVAIPLGQAAMAASLPVVLPSNQSAIPVTGTFWQATQPVSGTFWQATQPVSGTFWQATQPVSGTFWQATQPVSLAALPALVAGTANIGDIDVLTVPAPLNIVGPGSETTALRVAIGRPATAFAYNIPSQVHVAGANTVHWDMFNADATLIVRVVSIRQIPNITTAVTGVVFDWLLERTTSAGTGGSALTAWEADTNDTDLDADITARSKPTGAAAQSTDLFNYSISSEETNAATIMVASLGGLEIVPPHLQPNFGGKGIVLRQNQGIRCVQINSSNAGNTGWLISFTVE